MDKDKIVAGLGELYSFFTVAHRFTENELMKRYTECIGEAIKFINEQCGTKGEYENVSHVIEQNGEQINSEDSKVRFVETEELQEGSFP